jgi:hypothetical protein
MALARYRNRKDANQGEIVAALEKIGATVWVMDQPCDLLVGLAGKNWLLEVKDGNKPPSARKLTVEQEAFKASWVGQFDVVTSPQEAIFVVTQRKGTK